MYIYIYIHVSIYLFIYVYCLSIYLFLSCKSCICQQGENRASVLHVKTKHWVRYVRGLGLGWRGC